MDLLSKAIEGWSKHKPISYQKSVTVKLVLLTGVIFNVFFKMS